VSQKQYLVIHVLPDRCVESSQCEMEQIAAMRSRRYAVLVLPTLSARVDNLFPRRVLEAQ
jgi:hypothetical protein